MQLVTERKIGEFGRWSVAWRSLFFVLVRATVLVPVIGRELGWYAILK
jgi:hypothetical protein